MGKTKKRKRREKKPQRKKKERKKKKTKMKTKMKTKKRKKREKTPERKKKGKKEEEDEDEDRLDSRLCSVSKETESVQPPPPVLCFCSEGSFFHLLMGLATRIPLSMIPGETLQKSVYLETSTIIPTLFGFVRLCIL